jgi:hypothetical protein
MVASSASRGTALVLSLLIGCASCTAGSGERPPSGMSGAGGRAGRGTGGGSGGVAASEPDAAAVADAGAVADAHAPGSDEGPVGAVADAGGMAAMPAFCDSYPPVPAAGQWSSVHLSYDSSGKLVYRSDAEGNRIPDFSYSGYRYGEASIPDVPEAARLMPEPGDNTARIQQALDMVGARPPGPGGIRGALVLAPGRYEIAGTVRVNKAGVVLRGSGDGADPASATILVGTGDTPHQRTVVVAGSGSGNWAAVDPRSDITTPFVPVSALRFEVASSAGFAVGDHVIIHHPSTAAWVEAVEGGGTGMDPPWEPGKMDIRYNRRIAALSGNTITLDAPVYNHLDRSICQSYIAKVAPNFVTQVGIENLRVDIQTAGPEDENHAWNAVGVVGAQDSWVRGVTALHWGYAGIRLTWSVRVTIERFRAADPVAMPTGGRMYNIASDQGAQLILVKDSETSGGRHGLVSNGNTMASGIVYHRCKMDRGNDVEAGHKMWTQGVLYDNVVETAPSGTYILLGNRGDWGNQHGWSAVHSVIWNFNQQMIVQKPPTGQNYAVSQGGSKRAVIFPGPEGSVEINGPNLVPASLYEAQLCERVRR